VGGEASLGDPEPAPAQPEIELDPSSYAKATRSIEGRPEAMAHFYERLAAVAREELGAVARIAVYSDSINGSELITSRLRELFQGRFGDGGKGWVPISKGWPTQYHQDVDWQDNRSWLSHVVNRGNGPGARYGLGGVMSYNRGPHSRAHFATVDGGNFGRSVSRFRLFYQAWPRGGAVRLTVDDGEPIVVATESERVEDRVQELTVPDGPHRLEVGVEEGHLRLYGVVMERDGPGVVVDGLMLIGARARRLALFDGEHFGRQVALRQTDLLVFWMGGNDAESDYFDREGFLADYGAGIANARSVRPEASCLVVSIPDLGESPGGRTRRRVPQIVEASREVAEAHGCAYLNFFEAIGGAGTARRWYLSTPRILSGDYIHPTAAGAQVVGDILYQHLLRGFAEHLGLTEPLGAASSAVASSGGASS
jgi:lysophospholipase L1-like esterase